MTLKAMTISALGGTTGLTFAQALPSPEAFNGWQVHLVLGVVAIAAIYGIYKMAEHQTTSAVKQAEANAQMAQALATMSESVKGLTKQFAESNERRGRRVIVDEASGMEMQRRDD